MLPPLQNSHQPTLPYHSLVSQADLDVLDRKLVSNLFCELGYQRGTTRLKIAHTGAGFLSSYRTPCDAFVVTAGSLI